MSSLYIKLKLGFYTNRKTAKLRALIGDDAFWIPPRLWAYAAENQPDGDFSQYGSAELAMLLGCDKHASSIRQALLQAGFFDEPGVIHDWEEHNGYHKTYSDRARVAAEARWAKKEKNQKKEEDKKRGEDIETSIASSMLEASGLEAFRLRVGKMMGRRPTTAWSEAEMKKLRLVLAMKTQEDDLVSLETYYASGSPFLRRDITTLLNNWNGEIDRSKKQQVNGHHNPKPSTGRSAVIAERNATLGLDAAEHAAEARARARAIDEANAARFEATGLTPFDPDPTPVSGKSAGA